MLHDKEKRIAVTGMGVVSPLGSDLEAFHRSLSAGQDGVTELPVRFETGYKTNHAGLVSGFDVRRLVDRDVPSGLGRTSELALAACHSALRQAGLDPVRGCGLIVGTAMGEALELEQSWDARNGEGSAFDRHRVHEKVAAALDLGGPTHLLATTCASGNHAIDWACDLLRSSSAEAVLAVGVDTISHVDILGFSRLLLQAPDCCRPFDLHRKGTILAEGAGALVLEPLGRADERGAPILAVVAGCGASCDAAGAFDSKVSDVRSLIVAAEAALADAGIAPERIDCVSAHGSGTRLNDSRETRFVKELLGDRWPEVPMSSIKSMLGHAQGAAASFEAIASVLSLQRDVLYPTIHYETPDPQCDMDCVPNAARRQRSDVIMSNAFGVGGNNSIVLFERAGG